MSWKLEYFHNKPGYAKGQFSYARGLSVSHKTDNLIVGDVNNKRIQILDGRFNFLCSWDVEVSGSLLCPLALCRVDDNVLAATIEGYATLWECPDVADYKNVQPKLLHAFGNRDFVFPRAIIQNRKGQILVSDVGKHRISLHDMEGRMLKSIGSLGSDDAIHFNWPYYMCCDDTGRIVVSDSHNRCIKLFDEDLNYIRNFGKYVLTCCTGVAYSTDSGGRFFVGDYDKQSLMEFTKEGTFLNYVDPNVPYPTSDIKLDKLGRVVTTTYPGFFRYSKH